MFNRIPLGGEQLPGAGFHLGEDAPHLGEIGCFGEPRVAGSFEHLRELRLQGLDGPTDRVPVGYRVHSVELAHRAIGRRGQAIQIGIFRPVDVALLLVEAVEPQQGRFFASDIRRDGDGYPLVRMVMMLPSHSSCLTVNVNGPAVNFGDAGVICLGAPIEGCASIARPARKSKCRARAAAMPSAPIADRHRGRRGRAKRLVRGRGEEAGMSVEVAYRIGPSIGLVIGRLNDLGARLARPFVM